MVIVVRTEIRKGFTTCPGMDECSIGCIYEMNFQQGLGLTRVCH